MSIVYLPSFWSASILLRLQVYHLLYPLEDKSLKNGCITMPPRLWKSCWICRQKRLKFSVMGTMSSGGRRYPNWWLDSGPSWGKDCRVDGTIVEGSTTIDESMVTGESFVENQLVMQLHATINSKGTILFKAEKSVVRPSYLKLWTYIKWPNPVVLYSRFDG